MKKIAVATLGLGMLLGANAAGVFAEGPSFAKEIMNFGKMKPFMQQMHPNLNEKELKEMYESCHGKNGKTVSETEQQNSPVKGVNSF